MKDQGAAENVSTHAKKPTQDKPVMFTVLILIWRCSLDI